MIDESKVIKADSIFLLITKLTVLISGIFFIVGLCYSIGSDVGYGIHSSIPNTEILTLFGFFNVLTIIPEVLKETFNYYFISLWGILILPLIGIAVGLIFVVFFKFYPKLKKLEEELIKVSFSLSRLGYFILIGLFMLLMILKAVEIGKRDAIDKINILKTKGCKTRITENSNWSICSTVLENNKTLMQGYMIYKRGSEVAMISSNKIELVIFNIPKSAVIKRNFIVD
ncbi:hypothetical protein KO527_02635 [Pseudoalteromonas sp. C2R02]|uniref:hypothetical protein n=1 Tax=Pseudoalteromonas sp. C2R02 TaxID=2841565 RepID=UPI001C09D143|nr:hypothetical protein [Pseudoalteromonas sp. C2R02]MBU2968253.1 hypothetical protein [Pseudoalteromonas sp. C2R02]